MLLNNIRLKAIFVLIICFTGITSTDSFSQVRFGLRAGINNYSFSGQYENGEKIKNNMLLGYQAGIFLQIFTMPNIYLQPALTFITKGSDDVNKTDGQKASIYYIEAAINLVLKRPLGSGMIALGLGPYVSYALYGTLNYAGGKEEIVFRNNIIESDYMQGVPYLRPFDIGADINFGYEFDFGITANVSAQFGFLNLEPYFEGESSSRITRNRGFSVSLGYRF